MLFFYFQAVKTHATHVMSLLDRLMPALPDLQEAATLLSGSVYTLQTISHLCIPKQYFSRVSLPISTKYFSKQNYIVCGIMIFWREVHPPPSSLGLSTL
jgi:hypothetical protein